MFKQESYQWPFIFSALFHAGLFALLLFSFHDYAHYAASRQLDNIDNNSIIQVVAINQRQVETQTIAIKQQKSEQKKAVLKQEQALQQKQQQEKQEAEQLLAQKKQLALSETKLKDLPPPIKEPTITPKKPMAPLPVIESSKPTIPSVTEKKIKSLPEKKLSDTKKSRSKQTMEQALEKQAAQESLEQALASEVSKESKEAAYSTSAAQMQAEVDKYKALIVQSIAEHWLIPSDIPKELGCELFIRVAADGEVLSVEISRSSGDLALDRSARAAVFKASPLPVPKGADVFDKFRELRLTVHPERVL